MRRTIDDLTIGAMIIALTCHQFGDSGKGKFSDYFAAYWADVIARGTGGNNAGHTTDVGGFERIFHLVPAGITQDKNGKVNILGNGMVLDVPVLCGELDDLDRDGVSYNNLMISQDANVIMPYHIARDCARDKSQKSGGVGSTGRGIGPCYTDKIARRGIMIGDLFDRDKLARKIKKAAEFYPEQNINVDEIMDSLKPYADRIKPFVRDTIAEMHRFVRQGKKVLLEGAQGLGLSIEFGTYPFVTSSDCSLNGTASGVGIPASIVTGIGIVKYPFMTRVGAGPFPTELGGKQSEDYCAEDSGNRKRDELAKYGVPFVEEQGGKIKYNFAHEKILAMTRSSDPFVRGIGMRLAAGEYGATTGRPRRTGWTDAVMGRYAVGINGPLMILTKADCLSHTGDFNLCHEYNVDGKRTDTFSRDPEFLRAAKPVLTSYEGFGDISSTRDYESLPRSLKNSIQDFEHTTCGKVVAVSVGSDRDATIIR